MTTKARKDADESDAGQAEAAPTPMWEADGYEVADRTGYTLDLMPNGADPYYVIHRDGDRPVGIGAWPNDKAADEAIALDRDWLTAQGK